MATIRVTTAYAPVYPAYLEAAPKTMRLPNPPPALPFFRDKAHTVPVKWSLYRPLLKATSSATSSNLELQSTAAEDTPGESSSWPHIRRMIREQWSRQRQNSSLHQTQQFLEYHHTLLDHLRSHSSESHSYLQSLESDLSTEYVQIDASRAEKAKEKQEQWDYAHRKPRLTGGYIYPSYFNGPLPRMKPQPPGISGMIRKRIKLRDRRFERVRQSEEDLRDMQLESTFLRRAGTPWREWDEPGEGSWGNVVRGIQKEAAQGFRRDTERSKKKFSEETVLAVEAARKQKARDIQRKGLIRKGKFGLVNPEVDRVEMEGTLGPNRT